MRETQQRLGDTEPQSATARDAPWNRHIMDNDDDLGLVCSHSQGQNERERSRRGTKTRQGNSWPSILKLPLSLSTLSLGLFPFLSSLRFDTLVQIVHRDQGLGEDGKGDGWPGAGGGEERRAKKEKKGSQDRCLILKPAVGRRQRGRREPRE